MLKLKDVYDVIRNSSSESLCRKNNGCIENNICEIGMKIFVEMKMYFQLLILAKADKKA
jgi:hypothetical protein